MPVAHVHARKAHDHVSFGQAHGPAADPSPAGPTAPAPGTANTIHTFAIAAPAAIPPCAGFIYPLPPRFGLL
jgi:hypothetical protein